jgi:LasA protease
MRRSRSLRPGTVPVLIGFIILFVVLFIAVHSLQTGSLIFWGRSEAEIPSVMALNQATSAWGMPTRRPAGAPVYTPTPDAPHSLPAMRKEPEQYLVQPGDTLGRIAERYGISIEQIAQSNQIPDPNLLAIGQVLIIPVITPGESGPSFKIIPDSELVYGPSVIGFDVEAFIRQQGGFLSSYREQVEKKSLSGAQIVQQIAQDYSVNPRLLLALLQHQSGWLSDPAPEPSRREYPLGLLTPALQGLYRQLSWAANSLNQGFYQWRTNRVAAWVTADGNVVPVDPTINAGTAGIQHVFAQLVGRAGWEQAVMEQGFFATYSKLFGYPFDFAIEPPLPNGIIQPPMHLPFEAGVIWAFTGGPHSAWDDGSAWAALDFAPPGETNNCPPNNEWVTAVADGLVLRSGEGVVIQDLDRDGYEQTGWVMLYLHIETRDRVQAGAFLRAGERIGHPSCEGGVSTGTHLHLARRFNGEWISADQTTPFILDGWIASSAGIQYDGYLQRGGKQIEAYDGYSPENEIQH